MKKAIKKADCTSKRFVARDCITGELLTQKDCDERLASHYYNEHMVKRGEQSRRHYQRKISLKTNR